MIPFSVRHREALESKKVAFVIPKKVRQNIIYTMRRYNTRYGGNDEKSIFYDDLKQSLLESYGETTLKAYVNEVFQPTDDIEQFIFGSKPECVCDSIELYGTMIDEPGQIKSKDFFEECNLIFRTDNLPFRVLDRFIIKLDSDFLESEILNKALELLQENAFEKACKDFLQARNNFTGGDYSGTITEANNAIESTLK